MARLGERMIQDALEALRAWEAQGVRVPRVGVNFSNAELCDPRLVDRVAWELDRYELTPDRLVVEVLETVVAGRSEDVVVRNLAGLARLGCCLDLDDFGTGHASITSIRRFSIERIKIDRSFVTRIDEDPEQQRMVSAILTMAERLGLDTLAEGVETEAEQAMLARLGCGHVQGFGIARPMPLRDTRPGSAPGTAARAAAAPPAQGGLSSAGGVRSLGEAGCRTPGGARRWRRPAGTAAGRPGQRRRRSGVRRGSLRAGRRGRSGGLRGRQAPCSRRASRTGVAPSASAAAHRLGPARDPQVEVDGRAPPPSPRPRGRAISWKQRVGPGPSTITTGSVSGVRPRAARRAISAGVVGPDARSPRAAPPRTARRAPGARSRRRSRAAAPIPPPRRPRPAGAGRTLPDGPPGEGRRRAPGPVGAGPAAAQGRRAPPPAGPPSPDSATAGPLHPGTARPSPARGPAARPRRTSPARPGPSPSAGTGPHRGSPHGKVSAARPGGGGPATARPGARGPKPLDFRPPGD